MSDHITLPGTNEKVSTDLLPDGSKAQQVKILLGADGVNGGVVTPANPLPVSGPVTDAQLRASAVPVSGPVTDAQLRDSPLQVSDEDVAHLLVRVLNLLGAPVNYDPSLNRERVTAIVESGTVTTVGALTDMTNFGAARSPTELQNNQAIAAWAACHAARVF